MKMTRIKECIAEGNGSVDSLGWDVWLSEA